MRITPDAEALAACSRELIHIPGAIQPHGVLLAFSEPDLTCAQVSGNAATVFGCDPDAVLGRKFTDLIAIPPESWEAILADPSLASPVVARVGDRSYDLLLHRHDSLLIAELEPSSGVSPLRYHRRLQAVFALMRAAGTLPTLYEISARFISEITGYERVMVYRFDEDWHGEVVGEHLSAEVDSYMGHHFPASDIPEQARALYARSWLRIIPDASYTPVPLLPELNPSTGQPIDLSGSVLRSVSPIHLEYLRNMDVAASMSISLVVEGCLWGLIACHHREARALPYAARAACELFGQVASLEIGSQQETRRLAEHVQAAAIQTKFFDVISEEQNVVQALVKYTPFLLEFMSATGAVIYVNGKTTLVGETPAEPQVEGLLRWLQELRLSPLYATDALSEHFSEAAAYKGVASGLLAVKLSRVEEHYICWLRPEVVTSVTWAGNPAKPNDPDRILHPRKSFAAWTQELTGRSLPWGETEIQGAKELRTALNALVLRRSEHLLHLNAELEKKNSDLNSFAYLAAHDLKEPIRGISNYSAFIQEDHAAVLPLDAIRRLETISSLASRCETLLIALNRYSDLGRMDIQRTDFSLGRLVDDALENIGELIRISRIEIRRPNSLPSISCDPVLVREVFANLIANAIRYNASDRKWVEIGMRAEPEEETGKPVFYVRDNGIGIREKHHDSIFTMFRRLHAMGEYGTGTGAGLAIVRSIVERHGGRIWVDSAYGEGSTFYFTLT